MTKPVLRIFLNNMGESEVDISSSQWTYTKLGETKEE